MPRPQDRTRRKKRIKKALPGGVGQTHYRKKVDNVPHCRICGAVLAGFSWSHSSRSNKINRSRGRVWRPYGGEVCHNCLKNALKRNARAL